MAQFTIYKSSDPSAPTLSGTVGDLINLLDKCLVAGYGSKAAAGWTKPYTGTNRASFKQGAGSGLYLRVADDAPVTAKEARITGYRTMSDVNTGTVPFPDATQGIGGLAYICARKSATANATTRDWIVVADARTVYVFILTGDIAGVYLTFAFGDIYTLLTGDLYNCIIIGRILEDSANTGIGLGVLRHDGTLLANDGHFMADSYTGVANSIAIGKHSDYAKLGFSSQYAPFSSQYAPFPNPADGAAILSRVWVHQTGKDLRGRLRGIWCPCHVVGSFADGSTLIGTGELAGKTFYFIYNVQSQSGGSGVIAIETSNSVETN